MSSLSLGWAPRFLRVSRKFTLMPEAEVVWEPYAATATEAGLTTGTLPAGANFVQVTSGNAAHIVILPEPVVGKEVWLRNGATAYELQANDPATVAINAGTGASATSTVAASTLVRCKCDTATTWICTQFAVAGTESALDAAS
jgi:hypothetical protein